MQKHTSRGSARAFGSTGKLAAVILLGFSSFGCAGKAGEASMAEYPAAAPSREESSKQGYGYDYDGVTTASADSAPPPPAPESMPSGGGKKRDFGMGPSGNLAGAPGVPQAPTQSPTPTEPGPAAESEPKRAPLLIYDAVITLAVFKAAEGIDAVEKLAVESGGYLVQRTDSEIKIRVPASAFNSSLEAVTKLGDELHRQVNVRDVTEEFSDLQTRLQNSRAVRARLEELLKQAQKVEEALAVEKELERVAGEIEQILGRLKLLSELLSFSTITVRFEARPTDQVGSEVYLPFPWLHELGLPGLLSL